MLPRSERVNVFVWESKSESSIYRRALETTLVLLKATSIAIEESLVTFEVYFSLVKVSLFVTKNLLLKRGFGWQLLTVWPNVYKSCPEMISLEKW